MFVPFPAVAPLAPDCVTVHANVAPEGVDVNGMFVEVPEQIAAVAGTPLTTGVGFTVTTTSNGAGDEQVPIVGVML